jgi:hypothetical protein
MRLSRRGGQWHKYAVRGSQVARRGRRQCGSRTNKSEAETRKPQDVRATPGPEHLVHTSNFATHHLHMLSIHVLYEVNQIKKYIYIYLN